MSFEAPLISILGRTRYDLPACTVNGRNVSNWNKVKHKLNLTSNEQSLLFKLFKSKYQMSLKEKVNSATTCLESNKSLDSLVFNNFMREFIDKYKMCKKCGNPELCDGICKACGFGSNKDAIDSSVGEISKKDKLSKQEKRANKIKLQLENEQLKNKQEFESSDDEASNKVLLEDEASNKVLLEDEQLQSLNDELLETSIK